MRNPWDVLVPEAGDDSRITTAAAKGEATSAWESAEVGLGRLYDAVIESKGVGITHPYGEPNNFRDRLTRLQKAGESFFQRACDQALEADFEDVVILAQNLSVRRNEIVHSILQGIIYESDYQLVDGNEIRVHKSRIFLVPPDYTSRKFGPQSRPEFYYSSREIIHYEKWFGFLYVASINLGLRLSGVQIEPHGRLHPQK